MAYAVKRFTDRRGKIPAVSRAKPHPFLKWAGGKDELLSMLVDAIPKRWWDGTGKRKKLRRYHEPFLGGGALFFHLCRVAKLDGVGFAGTISDSNAELMDCWTAIGMEPEWLMETIDSWGTDHGSYYQVRAMKPWLIDELVVRAARTIYLNKTCFNGLYRLGPDFLDPRRRVFNVPWGKSEDPAIYDRDNIMAVHGIGGFLHFTRDFWDVESDVRPGDLVYFDPPYVPVKRTSFRNYGERFDYDDHEKLAELFEGLVARGAFCVLSNSDTPWVRDRYKQFEVRRIEASRSINSDGAGRGKVGEVIVVGGPK